jgi:hypothetical protein
LSWKHFDQYEVKYQIFFWFLIAAIQASLGASIVISDYLRLGIDIPTWQPVIWEISSQLTGTLLIFLIVWFDKNLSKITNKPLYSLIAHTLFSIVFSVLHVVGMLLLRKLAYLSVGMSYDFENWSQVLLYEYSKDGYSYVWIIGVIYSYRFIIIRLRGEAKAIAFGEDQQIPDRPERLLVKKINKEFIIRIEDIEWIEASGNYMNLHIANHTYPLRETMANLEKKLDPNKFTRIHRSSIVNLDFVKEIQATDSGDFDVYLNSEKTIKLSRRYREKIKSLLT